MANLRKKVGADPAEKKSPSEELVTLLDNAGAASQAYRMLRTNLFYAPTDIIPLKVVVLTSPGLREGKSVTCANLGVTLAQAGTNTLILDCDLRKPTVHSIFGLFNREGLTDVLEERKELQEVWQEPVPGLKVVPTGPLPPNPPELLTSLRFVRLLDRARKEFDYVLLDTPPVRFVPDPAILAAHGDGVLLVLDSQSTGSGALRQALRSLEGVGANVLGTVMNNVDASKGEHYSYGYPYPDKGVG
jgi:capsular exopolysaccharide synthesis family protein